jgi:hypothetical protein
MSEENKDTLLPGEENENQPENQVNPELHNEDLHEEEHLNLDADDLTMEKSDRQILEEIDNHLARQSEKEEEQHRKITVDINRLKNYSLKELADEFRDIMENNEPRHSRNALQIIRSVFLEKFEQAKEEALQKHIEQNGSEKGFYFRSAEKEEFDSLYREFKRRLKDSFQQFRQLLEENLKKKEEILDELRKLANGEIEGNASELYKRFNEIRTEWNKTKPVPREKYNELWETYKFLVEKFHEYIELDKEYRNKLYKENLQKKQKIIERAKELLAMDDAVKAFRELQYLHKVWKEQTGPVAKEQSEQIWQEFKDLTKQIHDKRREYLAQLREQYMQNLEKKKELITRLDEILQEEVTEHKRWQELLQVIEKLKEEFQNARYVPYKQRKEIQNEFYGRIREFNRKKNAFYKSLKVKQRENLQRKKELIEQVKALLNEEDVKSAHEKCKTIREEWRTIGFVPKKISDEIWNEFKEACNRFYEHYREVIKHEIDEEYNNYLKKKEFLGQLKADFKEGKMDHFNLDEIEEILQQWKEIGHVPENVRYINSKFNRFISALFSKLNLDENQLRMMQFKNMVQQWINDGETGKIRKEINYIRNKINEITDEIQNFETNLHFIKPSDDDNNPLLERLQNKINVKKKQLELWKEKLNYLLSLD